MLKRISTVIIPMVTYLSFVLVFETVSAVGLGQLLKNIEIQNIHNVAAQIPDFGIKPLLINYIDPDVADKSLDTPISKALKKASDKGILKSGSFLGMGIVNAKDSWIPNSLIKGGIGDKISENEKNGIPFEYAPIFIDQKYALKKSWGLGKCNGFNVVIVIGKDQKLKYFKKISTLEEANASAREVVETIQKELED